MMMVSINMKMVVTFHIAEPENWCARLLTFSLPNYLMYYWNAIRTPRTTALVWNIKWLDSWMNYIKWMLYASFDFLLFHCFNSTNIRLGARHSVMIWPLSDFEFKIFEILRRRKYRFTRKKLLTQKITQTEENTNKWTTITCKILPLWVKQNLELTTCNRSPQNISTWYLEWNARNDRLCAESR